MIKNFFVFADIISFSGVSLRRILSLSWLMISVGQTRRCTARLPFMTPNIERLAKRGMTFTDAYASLFVRRPSQYLDGQTPPPWYDLAAAHTEVRLKPVAQPAGLPHQKSVNIKTGQRIDRCAYS